MPRTRKLLTQTAAYMAGIGLSRGIAILLVPLYTRQLSEAEFFTWDVCATTVMFALAVAELGMSAAMPRFYILADAEDDRRNAVRTSSAIALISVLAFSAALLMFRVPLARFAFDSADVAHLVDLIALTLVLSAAGNLPLALLRAQERATAFAVISVLRALVTPAAVLVFLVFYDMGVAGVLLGDAIGLASVAIAGIALNRSQLLPRLDPSAARDLLRFGMAVVPTTIATAIVLVSDRYFLQHFVGPSEAATYSLGFKVATIVNLVVLSLQTAWGPAALRISKLPNAQQTLADMIRLMLVALGSLGLATTAVAPELTRVFAPAGSYQGAAAIVGWLAFAYVLQAAVYVAGTNLVIANRPSFTATVVSVGAVIKLALNYSLILRWGVLGAAAATLLAFAVQLALAYYFGQRIYPLPYDRAKLLALTLLLTAGAIGATYAQALPTWESLAVRLGILAAFPVGLVFLTIVKPHEINAVRRLICGSEMAS